MLSRTLWSVLLLSALLASLTAACGGGDGGDGGATLSEEQYRERLSAIDETRAAEIDRLLANADEEDPQDMLRVARGMSEVIGGGLAEFEALEPPAAFRDDHDRFLAGLREMLTVLDGEVIPALERGDGDAAEAAFRRFDGVQEQLKQSLSAAFIEMVPRIFESD